MLKAEVLFGGKTTPDQRNAIIKALQQPGLLPENWRDAKDAVTTIGFDSSHVTIAQKRKTYGCKVVIFFKGKSHIIENCKKVIDASKESHEHILFISIETELAGYKKVDGVYDFTDTSRAVNFLRTAPPEVLKPQTIALSQQDQKVA